jgi:NAD(P)-dependent dehydrogenase (short-subunit alcohol dehydrogenase family)
MSLFDLQGRVIVVTGALGQLGTQFCRALASHGANVAGLDLAEPAASRPREWLSTMNAAGAAAIYVAGDVTDRPSLERAAREVSEQLGPVFGLINNAGLDSPPNAPVEENGPFETYPEASWDRVLDVNLTGPMLCCQVFGGAMARAGKGSIVNIGSIYGSLSPVQDIYEYRRQRNEAFFKPVAYSASKSGLTNLTRYLATYWAPHVRVNTLTLAGVAAGQDSEFLNGYLARMPMRRMAEPDEYNGAAVFLMSDAARYMTGSNLLIDGGWSAW